MKIITRRVLEIDLEELFETLKLSLLKADKNNNSAVVKQIIFDLGLSHDFSNWEENHE